jgi:hypothetical protein
VSSARELTVNLAIGTGFTEFESLVALLEIWSLPNGALAVPPSKTLSATAE